MVISDESKQLSHHEELVKERQLLGEQLAEVGISVTHDLDSANVWLCDIDKIRRRLFEVSTEIEAMRRLGVTR